MNKSSQVDVVEGPMTDQEYDAIYKAAEAKIMSKYDQLTSAEEKKRLFQQITKLFCEQAGGMTLLAIIIKLE